MKLTAKTLALLTLKYTGGFAVARRLTGRGLRILCYHGITVADEHRFRGRLFMRPETFRERMKLLQRQGYPVISLADAVSALREGRWPHAAVVITFDDGWRGACETALEELSRRRWPVTLYVASHHARQQTPVANVAIQYLFWKTRAPQLQWPGEPARPLQTATERARAQEWALHRCGALADDMQVHRFLTDLASALDIDWADLLARGAFMLADREKLAALAAAGVDLQLHTHRHVVRREGKSVLAAELADNRAFLESIASAPLEHFCYPSGEYQQEMFAELEALGVKSATTCESGFNYAGAHPLALRRILDEEALSQLEFEAELSGVLEPWKWLRRRLRR